MARESWIDAVSRACARATSRKQFLQLVGTALLGTLLPSTPPVEAALEKAQPRKCPPPCPKGQACLNGNCVARTACPTRYNGQQLSVDFTTELMTDLGLFQLVSTTSMNVASGAMTTQIVITLKGNLVLRIDTTQTSANAAQASIQYGSAFHGIGQAVFSTDGQTVQGSIDNSATAPIAVGGNLNSITFANGDPLPTVTVDNGIMTAVQAILSRAQLQAPVCRPALSRPRAPMGPAGDPTPTPGGTYGQSDCVLCLAACTSAYFGCTAGSIGGCAALILPPLIAGCLVLAMAGCFLALLGCKSLCDNSTACCPVPCAPGTPPKNGCCFSGQTCLDPTASGGVCCPAGTTPCNQKSCCAKGQDCTKGVCCTRGREVCNNVCCDVGEVCHPTTQTCCRAGRACGNACCSPFEECIDSSKSACCPRSHARCNGLCCPRPHDLCVGGACCPKERACGESCCPAGQFCQNAATETCSACPPGQLPCANTAGGDPPCCAQGSTCCTNGKCCPKGQLCCGDPPTCRKDCIR